MAYISLQVQLNEARETQSINQQADTYLKYIMLLGSMIDKRWKVVFTYCEIDFEKNGDDAINYESLRDLSNKNHMISDVIKLMRLFHDLNYAVQWYTFIHKRQISENEYEFPLNEWAHFSNALISEHSKKMKFCYHFGRVMKNNYDKNSVNYREIIMFENLYENYQNQNLV